MSAALPFLVIGQGLAGSLVADRLRLAGREVHVVDRETGPRSSLVAGGLFNPITGRRANLTWMAHELFTFLASYYPDAERRLGGRFYHPAPIYKPFSDQEQQNELLSRTADPAWSAFLSELASNPDPRVVLAPHGGIEVRRGGWVDVPAFVEAVRISLGKAYRVAEFDWKQVERVEQGWRWAGETYQAILLCQGIAAQKGGPFEKLPFSANHGQLLRVRFEKYEARVLLNRGVFVRPTETKGEYLVGATYERQLHNGPSEAGIQDVKERLKALVDDPYEILDTPWGWRPATYDRRPLVGIHPQHAGVYVLNGLGSKGVSLGPYWADRLVGWLLGGPPLDPAVNILRCGSLS